MGTRGNWECVHDNSCVHYMCAWCECDMTQHALRLLRISAEKKTCVCVNTKRKKLIRMTCLLERTALLLFPLLFLLVVTVRCLCVIVVFVWVISHSDLRSGQRALMHMGKKSSPSEQTALLPHTPLHHPLFYSHVPLSHNEETRPRLLLLPYLYFS